MLMTDLHGPKITNDCGTFTPRHNIANGHEFCANCTGWRIWHEPYATTTRLERLTDYRRMIDALFIDATSKPLFRARLIGFARSTGWLATASVPIEERDGRYESRMYADPSPYETLQSPGAPDLILFGTDRLRPVDPIDPGRGLMHNARRGGMLAIWLSNQGRKLYGPECDFADRLQTYGAECHIWTRDDLYPIVARLSGTDLSEVLL